ncbi:TPA: glycosyl transferase [Candidatus Sumerlaeota bacterium]|jgi:dolichyl-phosphate beta-glucosyltransferase|nr:glycosyl transferase [Candidatus Sumerlaeota bacterium]
MPTTPATSPQWTLVIPAYNEETRLGETLQTILAYVQEHGLSVEILVVNDGSTDGTASLVREQFPQVRLEENPGNRGKGYSVRAGMLTAHGKWVLFSDADLSTPIDELPKFEAALRDGADVVIGSRVLRGSVLEVRQPWWRELSGRTFNLLVRLFSALPYHDTQCGFKAYQRDAAQRIAQAQQLTGWAFDVEQLVLAKKMSLRVTEVPVRWINSAASRVNMLRDAPRMLRDVIKIRWMHR